MPASLGILVVDSSGAVVAANGHALRILGGDRNSGGADPVGDQLSRRVRELTTSLAELDRTSSEPKQVRNGGNFECFWVPMQPLAPEGQCSGLSIILLRELDWSESAVGELAKEYGLTNRERETLVHALNGSSGKEIAEKMKISTSTVKSFLRMVSVKMGVTGRAALFAKLLKLIT